MSMEVMVERIQIEGSCGIAARELVSSAGRGGIIDYVPIELPAYKKAVFYAPFQKYAIIPGLDLWPEGYNQCQPLAVDHLSEVGRGGMMALLELTGGGYLALLPVVTQKAMSAFTWKDGQFALEVAHWGIGSFHDTIPLMAWAKDDNPYAACERVWREVLKLPDVSEGLKMRSDKLYPEPFEYLGWCSWEHYREDISEELMIKTVYELNELDVPVRWVLVDDGHLHHTKPNDEDLKLPGIHGEVAPAQKKKRLIDFGVDRSKFPNGWETLKEAQKNTKIRWLGVWLNFNGYWGGISSDADLGELSETLLNLTEEVRQPGGNGKAHQFYDALIKVQQCEGFDFVKVDNQASNICFYKDRVDQAVSYAVANHRGLEEACAKRLKNGLINCMAHNNIGLFNTRNSSVTRCSEDYLLGDEWRGKMHIFNSYGNMMMLGPTVWGDHDMFHTTDKLAGGVMARSKALSGGPIYLSDAAENVCAKAVKPLCLEDGKVLRPLAPAVPLPDSLFMDPYKDGLAFRVIAPLRHGVAAVALYNLSFPEKPIIASVTESDYCWAGGMLQDGKPEWHAREGVVIYDVLNQTAQRDAVVADMRGFGDEMFLLSPIRSGWAVIGSPDKYLCSEVVEHSMITESKMELRLRESGEILFWLESGVPTANDGVLMPIAPQLWRVSTTSVDVVIERR